MQTYFNQDFLCDIFSIFCDTIFSRRRLKKKEGFVIKKVIIVFFLSVKGVVRTELNFVCELSIFSVESKSSRNFLSGLTGKKLALSLVLLVLIK